jgi:hypothetical protein
MFRSHVHKPDQENRLWSYRRQALDDFVEAAREFYINSPIPPRRLDFIEDKVHSESSPGACIR